jgi:hypothetical protein
MKTLNLEQFGLVELNESDLTGIEGGLFWFVVAAVALLGCASVKPMELGGAVPMETPIQEVPCPPDSCAVKR